MGSTNTIPQQYEFTDKGDGKFNVFELVRQMDRIEGKIDTLLSYQHGKRISDEMLGGK